MPFADPEKKKQWQKQWNDKKLADGYGKALYARRAARYRNEEILRGEMEDLLSVARADLELGWLVDRLERALKKAPPIGQPKDYMP